ncbi:MAG: 1-acyl-sn-glycerol-3-phosphate acyltransferase [Crocinitomicaceae bacterium]|nr:1-acyl-sn-glycerol-3-phosphate acyltransferase [Crocinitomicaceae bacterium]
MRPLYFFLKLVLPYAYTVFFRRKKLVNSPGKFKSQTIYVSNHPSAFLDPLIVASVGRPIVFFMTRSDVFKDWLKPVTWACQMVPIYRADQDGSGTYDKNQKVFKDIQKVLRRRGNLIMFGEGYTDNVFIRSLKPLKKGPPRIGFGTMEATNWELDIKIQAVGINYANPDVFRSDVVISWGDPIRLKDYEELYKENPSKTILQLMRRVEKEIQENITYIEDKTKAPFHERLMVLTRKGMSPNNFDKKYPVIDRMRYSQNLAKRINTEYKGDSEKWSELEGSVNAYFDTLQKKSIEDEFVHQFQQKGRSKGLLAKWAFLILTFPLFLLGTIHNAVPYYITKLIVEKIFERRVFWSGVKVVLGGLFWLLYNLPIFWLFPEYIYPHIGVDGWLAFVISFVYFWTVPALTFIFWNHWKTKFGKTIRLGRIPSSDLEQALNARDEVMQKVNEMNI